MRTLASRFWRPWPPCRRARPAGFNYWSLTTEGLPEAALLEAQRGEGRQRVAGQVRHSPLHDRHREANGQAEWHETEADVFVVESGEATLLVGGTMSAASRPRRTRCWRLRERRRRTQARARRRGAYPSKMPHQLLVAPGKQFTYFVVKITE